MSTKRWGRRGKSSNVWDERGCLTFSKAAFTSASPPTIWWCWGVESTVAGFSTMKSSRGSTFIHHTCQQIYRSIFLQKAIANMNNVDTAGKRVAWNVGCVNNFDRLSNSRAGWGKPRPPICIQRPYWTPTTWHYDKEILLNSEAVCLKTSWDITPGLFLEQLTPLKNEIEISPADEYKSFYLFTADMPLILNYTFHLFLSCRKKSCLFVVCLCHVSSTVCETGDEIAPLQLHPKYTDSGWRWEAQTQSSHNDRKWAANVFSKCLQVSKVSAKQLEIKYIWLLSMLLKHLQWTSDGNETTSESAFCLANIWLGKLFYFALLLCIYFTILGLFLICTATFSNILTSFKVNSWRPFEIEFWVFFSHYTVSI